MSYAHDLARRYNERLAVENYRRADEIEWVVTGLGTVALRDIPEASRRRMASTERSREAERKRWADEHHAEHRPFAPPQAEERLAL